MSGKANLHLNGVNYEVARSYDNPNDPALNQLRDRAKSLVGAGQVPPFSEQVLIKGEITDLWMGAGVFAAAVTFIADDPRGHKRRGIIGGE